MKVRFKSNPNLDAFSTQFNIHGIGEVITQGTWGADSSYVRDLDVFLESTQRWKDMSQAFVDRDIIPDNYNIWFAEPKTEQDRQRGYFL